MAESPVGAAPSAEPSSTATAQDHSPVEPDRNAFVVVVFDPLTDETDAYGPLSEWDATMEAVRRQDEFIAESLDEVVVTVVPLQPPAGGGIRGNGGAVDGEADGAASPGYGGGCHARSAGLPASGGELPVGIERPPSPGESR